MTFTEMEKKLGTAAGHIANLMERVPDKPYMGMDRHDTIEHYITITLRELWEVVDGLKQEVEKQGSLHEAFREALQSS